MSMGASTVNAAQAAPHLEDGRPLRVLFAAAEVAPLVKTGGLADVAGTLPAALRAQGHDVRIAMPCYASVPDEVRGESVGVCSAALGWKREQGALRFSALPGADTPLYLVEHDGYFHREHPYGWAGGEYEDNLERFSFFCQALLDGLPSAGWVPDIVHCNDWQTALLPAHLATTFQDHPEWEGTPSLFTIHNILYQGIYPAAQFPLTGLDWEWFRPEWLEFHGKVNLMKAGIGFATKVSTVSARYAREIQTPPFGQGLDGYLRMRREDIHGIVNGVAYDHWSPAADPDIAARYDYRDVSRKLECKADLQRRYQLPERDVPLLGMVSRLYWEKGLDLLLEALPDMLREDIQLVVLGTGDIQYESALLSVERRYRDRMRVTPEYDERMARRIYAGSDFFLMPSLTEPCGLSQLYSLSYGAIPIVHATGGLADTVFDVSPANLASGKATGVVFGAPSARALKRAFQRAMALYEDKETLQKVRLIGMRQDFSWERASDAYVKLYRRAIHAR